MLRDLSAAVHAKGFELLVTIALGAALVPMGRSRPNPLPEPPPARLAQPALEDGDALDRLRTDAHLGSADAGAAIATTLLNRYETAGSRDDLYEAVQWIARDWDQEPFLRTDTVQRVVLHHCQDRVLKWHWLCVGGE